jgi:hypothetical protein
MEPGPELEKKVKLGFEHKGMALIQLSFNCENTTEGKNSNRRYKYVVFMLSG